MSTEHKPKFYTRIAEAMMHTSRYSVEGKAKLARDCGVSKTTIQDLIAGTHNTTYTVLNAVLEALGREVGRTLDVRELVSFDGKFERPICAVVGCRNCLPLESTLESGRIAPDYVGIKAGQWFSFRDPSGRSEGDQV